MNRKLSHRGRVFSLPAGRRSPQHPCRCCCRAEASRARRCGNGRPLAPTAAARQATRVASSRSETRGHPAAPPRRQRGLALSERGGGLYRPDQCVDVGMRGGGCSGDRGRQRVAGGQGTWQIRCLVGACPAEGRWPSPSWSPPLASFSSSDPSSPTRQSGSVFWVRKHWTFKMRTLPWDPII